MTDRERFWYGLLIGFVIIVLGLWFGGAFIARQAGWL